MSKSEELQVFKKFAPLSHLDVDRGSIKQPEPPAPDIFCIGSNGESFAFELVNIADEGLKRQEGTDVL